MAEKVSIAGPTLLSQQGVVRGSLPNRTGLPRQVNSQEPGGPLQLTQFVLEAKQLNQPEYVQGMRTMSVNRWCFFKSEYKTGSTEWLQYDSYASALFKGWPPR